MKTFKDLEFKPHPMYPMSIGVQARIDFKNGYGVSVIQTPFSYTVGPNEWKLAVFHDGDLCYSSPITDDVLGHLSKREVSSVMQEVQKLPKKKQVVNRINEIKDLPSQPAVDT